MSHPAGNLTELSPLQRAAYALKELRVRLDAVERARNEPIAIIGMGCRFPGGADTPEKFWELLRDGVDAVTEVPRSRWDIDAFYDPDPAATWKMYTREGGFLREPVDAFDPRFFGIAPREAAGMDPQHRLLLEVSWEALEHAGIAPDRLAGSNTGVYVGVITADYGMIHPFERVHPLDLPYMGTGSATSFPAGRISYVLGLQGPCMVIATACSSALVSVHLAMQALRNGECDLALAGGVNLMFAPEINITLSRMRALAADGRCKAFDASADGYGRGEGCGIVVLKRLSDALRDGDAVLAVLKGSAVNHDGASGGLSVPNGPAQETVLRKALASAGIAPHEVDYVEAHGTGTSLGDPIEANALDAVMSGGRSPDAPLLVGSVKTNIGHLEAAAGVAGLMKVVLALRHESIPPSLHFHRPNPHIDWQRARIAITTKSAPWPAGGRRRLAGVSSFGLSGINAHLVVEEAPPQAIVVSGTERPCHILTLSAAAEAALRELAGRYAKALSTPPLAAASLVDICGAANNGRAHLEHRAGVVAATHAELREALDSLAAGHNTRACVHQRARSGQSPKVAFLFTGQGSVYARMGRQLYETHAAFRDVLDRCDSALRPYWKQSLDSVIRSEDLLEQTGFAQPALFALSAGLAEVWKSWGVVPGAVIGHSVGEYAAAYTAGVFSLEDGVRLVAERGRLMQALPPGGGMAAVFGQPARVSEILRQHDSDVVIAGVNGPEETVISGRADALDRAIASLSAAGIRSTRLRVSHAFHSPLMEPMLSAFRTVAAGMSYREPRTDFISNLSGNCVNGSELNADYWRDHARQPVRFSDGIETLARRGFDTFVEIGPQPVLLGLARQCLKDEGRIAWLPSLRRNRSDWQELLASLSTLYIRGCTVDWREVSGPYRRVELPSYPFQRQRYWVELVNDDGAAKSPATGTAKAGHTLLGARLDSAAKTPQFESRISAQSPAFLADHKVGDVPVLPAAAYIEMALAAGHELQNGAAVDLEELVFLQPIRLVPGETHTIQLIAEPGGADSWDFGIHRRAAEGWEVHCNGRILRRDRLGRPAALDIDELRRRCSTETPVQQYYAEVRALGLDYGPAFRVLEEVWRGNGETLARIRLPKDAGTYRLHPAILDGCLQALGAALPAEYRKGAYLPVAVDRFRCYRDPETDLWVHGEFHFSANGQTGLSASLHLMNAAGEVIADAARVRFARANRDHSRDWMYEVSWQEQALPVSTKMPVQPHWLILGDGCGTARTLAARLGRQRQSCTLLPSHGDLDRWFAESDRPVHGVVDLGSLEETPAAETDEAVRHHCVRLLRVAQALARHPSDSPPALFVVTRGAAPVGSPLDISGLAQAPLLALGKAIAAEHPESRCRNIDLDPGFPEQEVEHLYRELVAATSEDTLALRGPRRLVPRLARKREVPSGHVSFVESAAYLITGGLGGLGLQVAHWMVERGARHLVLLGRSGPSKEAETDLETLRKAGAEIRIVQADVSRRDEMARALLEISESGYPLRGLFHAAGVLDDGILVQQTPERFARVLEPKVSGAWHLHRLTEKMQLDFFVLFSSAASLMGKPGQSSYVAANGFLDGLAHHRRSLGLPCVSINWGAWSEVGASANLKLEKGIGALTPEQGLQLLEAALLLNPVQVGIMPLDWELLDLPLSSPFFSAFARRPGDSRPEFRRQLESMSKQEGEQALLDHVLTQVREVSGLRDGEELEPRQGFFDLGLDSLMSVELRNRLQSSLGCSLPVTAAFQHPSVEALAGYLAKLVLPSVVRPPTHGAPAQDLELDALLCDVDQLSEEEASAALVRNGAWRAARE